MMRILIVDDELDILEALQDLLEGIGYEVATATNGEAGLRKAAEVRPDLMIVDVMMPMMSGPQMLQQLRAGPRPWTIPVILMSAGAGEELARTLGVSFLRKPFSIREVKRQLHELLSPGRATKSAAED